jgi:hypothetical protein
MVSLTLALVTRHPARVTLGAHNEEGEPMADPTTPAAPTAPADPAAAPVLTPGNETSEFKLTKVAMICSIVVAVLGGVTETLQQVSSFLPGATWVGPALTVVGILSALAAQIAYTVTRGVVKAAHVTALGKVAVANATAVSPAAAAAAGAALTG